MRRRGFLLGASALALSGCDRPTEGGWLGRALGAGEPLNQRVQRTLAGQALAPEYTEADIRRDFRANGSIRPTTTEYLALKAHGFDTYRLRIEGLVDNPLSLSLAQLRMRRSRTQITRHDCVEGWSSIGKWTGVRLSALLEEAQVRPEARFLVFYCFDALSGDPDGERYYTSIDLNEAHHEQTILAYDMNDQILPEAHGAPLRLRLERQLGYKMAKYIKRIEAVESFAQIGRGKGGFWEDRGYAWYAGI